MQCDRLRLHATPADSRLRDELVLKQGCVDGNIHNQLPGFRLFGSLRTAAGARSATASRSSSVESVIIGGFATNFAGASAFARDAWRRH